MLVRAEPVWDPGEHTDSWRAVWAYPAKLAIRDTVTLTLQENKAKLSSLGEKAAQTSRLVKPRGGQQRSPP